MIKRISMMLTALLIAVQCMGLTQGALPQAKAAGLEQTGEKLHYYITPNNFNSFGTWKLAGDYLEGRATASTPEEADPSNGEPAIAIVNIQSAGDYRVWVRDRDFSQNQPGTRTFHVAVNGTQVNKKFGIHGYQGFRWSEVGVYSLNEGAHELSLIDSSGFFARSEGFFLTKDLNLVPPEDLDELALLAPPEDAFGWLPPSHFPEWAEQDVSAIKTASMENEKVKIVFHQGTGTEGSVVQNEIYIKDDEEWMLVKPKTEQLGFLMMSADSSELVGQDAEFGQFIQVKQELTIGENSVSTVVKEFFKSGVPTWFIPSDFEQVSENQINLSFNNTEADLQVSFMFDDLSHEPKVTLDAQFQKQGAYSFLLFNGNETAYEDYETVTAPLLYVKKTVPELDAMIPEPFLFTPMATLHYEAGNERFHGVEMTAGIVMDPESVGQEFTYPDTASFALVLRGPDGDVRPQFAAPMFGTEHSLFEANDTYSVSYRIINEKSSWYDTYKHVAEDLYNVADIRTNIFHSVNEAIYNATDLMMDDFYGGWDEASMAHYNMEEQDLTSTSNGMSALQRYLLTENEDILDERAIPTLAFMLNHMQTHYKTTESTGGANYIANLPSPIGNPVKQYSAGVYSGLYEMTQGRMPYLLDHALSSISQQSSLTGVTDHAALYNITKDEQYLERLIVAADRYLTDNPKTGENRERIFTTGFVFADFIPMVTTLLAAYEATGDSKYLEAAEENAHLLMAVLWTTGYHADYADAPYTVTNETTGARYLNAEQYSFWWHGDKLWRLGNEDGYALPPQISGPEIPTETQPGWLSARVGMGTEHFGTPAHGNVITMNNWAGTLMKLGEYTGDEFFSNAARNAIIGRFGNYPGYYQDRIIFHQMKEDYPYVGPDFTSIYFHHIPVFITMLEDFLINSAWAKSERSISFPSLNQSGYAYFVSNQFGHAPGKFYEEEDMWLWLDRGIIDPDTVEIDYIAAKKDGVLGLALMNEANNAVESTMKLGDKVDPHSAFNGTATVYEADGTKSSLQVVNGEFTIVIPAKGIRSVVLHDVPAVYTPKYAKTDYEFTNETEDTVSEHERGKGYVLQVSPDSYHAYVYVTDMDDTTSKVTLNYMIDGESTEVSKVGYPYEFLIKVEDPEAVFTYELIAENNNGFTVNLGNGTLKANRYSGSGIVEEVDDSTVQVRSWVTQTGSNPSTDTFRFVVPIEDFYPLAVTEDLLKGMEINVHLRHKEDGYTMNINSVITANEMRANRTMVIVVPATPELKLGTYPDYDVRLSVAVPNDMIFSEREQHPQFPIEVTRTGELLPPADLIRLVANQSSIPSSMLNDNLIGYRAVGTITKNADNSELYLDSTVVSYEKRNDGTILLDVIPTADVPRKAYGSNDYSFDLELVLPVLDLDSLIELEATNIGENSSSNVLRVVVKKESLPFPLTSDNIDILNGYRITGEIKNRNNGTISSLDSVIVSSEVRPSDYVLLVRPTSRVSRSAYSSSTYDYFFTLHPQKTGTWKNEEVAAAGDYEYEIDPVANTVTITRFTGTRIADIPSIIAGLPVTSIGAAAFQNKRLTSITIPDSITHIGQSAFRDNQLTNVKIPASIASIDDAAFRLNALEYIVIGGIDTAFNGHIFTSNPDEFAIIGYMESTARSYAEANSHNFIDITPVITFDTDGNEAWSSSIATIVTVERHGAYLEYVWTASEVNPGIEADWQPFVSGEEIEKLTGDGEWTLHIRTADLNGVPAAAHSRSFKLDGTPPSVNIVLTQEDSTPYMEAAWTDQTVSAAIYAQDDRSGLQGLQVSFDGGETWNDIDNESALILDEDGIYVIQFQAADQAGNEIVVEKTIKISKHGLVMNTILNRDTEVPYTSGTWTNQTVTANVYAYNSNVITIVSVTYSLDQGVTWLPLESPLVFTEDGTYSLSTRVVDTADNMLTEQSAIWIDKTAPTIQFTPDGSESAASTASTFVIIEDSGSGIDANSLLYIWSNSSITPEIEEAWQPFANGAKLGKDGHNGDWFLHIRAADLIGNEAIAHSQRFIVYNAAPVTEPEHNNDNATVEPGEANKPVEPETPQEPEPSEEPEIDDQDQTPTPDETIELVDIKGHWSESNIKELVARGIINGYPNGTFQPDKVMTRAEFITIIVRAFGMEETSDAQFDDTIGHWAHHAISTAIDNGLINGFSATRFGPDDFITREQMIVIMVRVLNGIADNGANGTFTDAAQISPWAQDAVYWSVEQGIINGYPDSTFRPNHGATRAEAITIVIRALAAQANI